MTGVPPSSPLKIWARPIVVIPAAVLAVVIVAAVALLVAPGSATAPLSAGQSPVAGSSDNPASDDPVTDSGSGTVTIAGVGDTVLGAIPDRLPPGDGAGFFDRVSDELSADVMFGNLEGPLSERTDFEKCDGDGCVYLRMPNHYAPRFAEAGFDVMNIANNHGYDAGPEGVLDTQRALSEVGIPLAGIKGEVVELEVKGLTVAVVGVAAYDFYTNLLDLSAVDALVSAADQSADLVVFSMHIGAEGTDARHVTGADEEYFGEPRGNSTQVAHTAIDAGADVVFGHGPHVLRGIEYYNGRIIAHSLGNFAGYGVLDSTGALGRGAILKVTMTPEGEFVSGSVVATHMVDGGYPAVDHANGAWSDFNELAADFGSSGVTVAEDGSLVTP